MEEKDFSFMIAFYKHGIFSVEDGPLLKEKTEEAEKLEMYFLGKTGNVKLIRQNILLSYMLDKKLKYKDRINYIRGIIYGRKYIDYEDLIDFENQLEFERKNNESSQSLFSIKHYKSDLDSQFFESYFDFNSEFNKTGEDFEKLVDAVAEEVEDDDTLESDGLQVLDHEEDNKKDKDIPYVCYQDLSCHQKIELFDEYLDLYVEGLCKAKGLVAKKEKDIEDIEKDDIPELKDKHLVELKERGIVLKGIYDWYNHIIKQFYILLDKYEFLSTYNSDDLSFLL